MLIWATLLCVCVFKCQEWCYKVLNYYLEGFGGLRSFKIQEIILGPDPGALWGRCWHGCWSCPKPLIFSPLYLAPKAKGTKDFSALSKLVLKCGNDINKVSSWRFMCDSYNFTIQGCLWHGAERSSLLAFVGLLLWRMVVLSLLCPRLLVTEVRRRGKKGELLPFICLCVNIVKEIRSLWVLSFW